MNFPLGASHSSRTTKQAQNESVRPGYPHQDERNPGVKKRKSWETRQGRIMAGRQRLRAQSASSYTELGLGKGGAVGSGAVQADLTSWMCFWVGMKVMLSLSRV